ncbi:MAG TPA: DUF4372 domain-containing protein [Thermoanaerobaculia bacterium]|jgi:ABC-type taurine transport system ATPase subunit|nr:DUF4372 domain-containing protein [Thermoanaerobaculia bacterium]
MNVGKTLFAQVMEFVPWKTFGRIVERHKADAGMRTLSCADLFRVMTFAQLTWRESLRDIEACLAANQTKLFHMGMKASPVRSTLADALERRDWHIYHGLAQRLIARAKALYAQDPSVLELDASVYALDSSTIDLCLSLFDWKTQIWCAVATYVLIAIVKKELQLEASLYTCLQILSVSIFEKTEISCALQPDRSQREIANPANQLILFDF